MSQSLLEAKLDLAEELGQTDDVIELLKEMIQIDQLELKQAQLLEELGRGDTMDLAHIQTKILKTEIRIIRAENRK